MGKKKAGEEEKAAENIKVIVRCRPLNSKELDHGYSSCVDLNLAESTVQVNHVCGNPDRWTFDGVVNNTYTQKDIFTQFIMPMVDSVMDGFNSTVFAYGQSGSGKTHTMTGVYDDDDLKGVIPRSFSHLFDTIKQQTASNPNKRYSVYCSFIELYNGKVRDLLVKKQETLLVKENKDKTFFVQGAHIPQVKFEQELTRHMEEGTDRRAVDATDLNAASSRSHSIFTVILECTETSDDGDTRSVTSKLNLVDLAGSERQSKTGASGDTLKEGCNINLSLSALGTVIDTLVKGKGHIPFRSSPLTMLLKDSLGGSSKTCMFANVGPSEHNISETVSTLRFADRAKQIKNKPIVNMDSKDQKIAELSEQVADLKAKLQKFESGGFTELEDEVEQLRERCGELEVDRDNAVKGREADEVDFERVRETLQQQVDTTTTEKEELTDRLNGVQEELRAAEEMNQDTQQQVAELWKMCSQEFNETIDSSDTLISKVRELNNGVTRKQYETLQSQCSDFEAELANLKGQMELEVGKWKAAAETAEEELSIEHRKLEKAKGQLHNEQNARKQLIENQQEVSPHRSQSFMLNRTHDSEEVDELKAAVNKLEEERSSRSDLKELEERLEKVSSEKEKTIRQLSEEVSLLTKKLNAGEGEGEENIEWAKLLAAKDAALATSRAEVETLESELRELQRGRFARRRSSQRDLLERREVAYRTQRDALEDELKTTSTHRDNLLLRAIERSGDDGNVDLTEQIQLLQKENESLRGRLSEITAAPVPQASSDSSAQVSKLEAQLQKERDEFALKEQKMLEAIDSEENPLQAVLDLLKAEKQQLASSMKELTEELSELRQSQSEDEQEQRAELKRLQSFMAMAQNGDSEVVAELKTELRKRDDEMKRLRSRPAKEDNMDAMALVEEQSRHLEQDFRSQLDLVTVEKQQAVEELEAVKLELQEAEARRVKAEEEKRRTLEDVAAAKAETVDEHRRTQQTQHELEALRSELDHLKSDSSSYTSQIDQLDNRVKERTEQLKTLRATLDNQRGMMTKMKQKLETQQQSLNSAKQELQHKDQQHQNKLQEQAEHLQRMTNKKLEQQSDDFKKLLAKKDDDIHAVRKKMKKLDDKLEKARAKYDEKVCEYAELQTRMEEQKIEQMQAMREEHVQKIESGQDSIRDTLQDAKEAQRRKADLFSQGEVTSAFANLRAAGNAAVALNRARNMSGASVTPPVPPTGQPSHSRGLYD